MGLFDQLVGAVAGSQAADPQAAAAPPAPETALQGVINLLHSPSVGGVGGLVKLFEQHGQGATAAGWVNQGPNPAVAPSQLMQILGPERIEQFATHLGLPPGQASEYLAKLLPHVVDHLTPDGTVPATPAAGAGVFDLLKGRLLGG